MSATKDPRALAVRLLSWMQEELAAQRRTEALLEEQERCVRAADAAGVAASAEKLAAELRASAEREKRRAGVLRELARAFGCDARALTASSVIARLEAHGGLEREADALRALRADLRRTAADVARRGRRLAGVARHHAQIFDELVAALFGAAPGAAAEGGALVDARA